MKNALERFLKLKKQYILKIILLFFMLGYFLHFYPPDSPKNRNLKRMKKTLEVSLFYTSVPKIMIKNHDHMLYCSWDMVHDGYNCYFSHWAIFCPFTSKLPKKSTFFKKWKKMPRDIILNKCTKNYNQMMYGSWDIVCDGQMNGQMDGKSAI